MFNCAHDNYDDFKSISFSNNEIDFQRHNFVKYHFCFLKEFEIYNLIFYTRLLYGENTD